MANTSFKSDSKHHSNPAFSSNEKSTAAFFGASESQQESFFPVQAKLTIGKPNDKYEQEADAVADKVVERSHSESPTFFNAPSTPVQRQEEDNIQEKPLVETISPLVQRQEEEQLQSKPIFESPGVMDLHSSRANEMVQGKAATAAPSSNFESQLSASKGSGSPLPQTTRAQMESGFGADFSHVRVHTGNHAAQMSQDIGAQAFTHGSDIYFNQGKYNPSSSSGQHLLAHELTHTVQQGGGVRKKPLQIGTAPEMVQGFGVVDLIPNWIINNARHIPGYTLFTVIIEYDPLLGESVERTPIKLLEGLMGLVPFGTAIFDKLQEYGIIQQVFDWVQGQLNSLNLSTQGFLNLIQEAWDEIGLNLFDAIDIITEKFQRLVNQVETFATSLIDQIIQWIKDALIGVAEPLLAENRAWSLIKKIIHYDPLRGEEIQATTVEILEDFLLLIGKETELEQMRERGTLQQTADWLDTQVQIFDSLLGELGGLITALWDAIQPENLVNIADNLQTLATQATGFLQRVWDFASTVALQVLELIKDSLLAWLSSFATNVPGYHLLTVILGKDIFTQEDVPRTVTNIIRGFMSLMPGGEAQFQQMQETGVIPQAAQRIEALISELDISWEFIVNLFTDLWNSLTIDDLLSPLDAFQRIVDRFAEPISRLFSFVIQVVLIVLELILRLMNFPFELIERIMSNAMAAFEDIQRDPIGFLMNMLEAVKLGFTNFFENILTHLGNGLADWFFGQLEKAGIARPPDLSLGSILDVVLEILGISMDRIWEKLAERIGQENVDRIRGAIDQLTGIWTFISDVQERGVAAIWEYIEGQISNLWNMLLEQATNWIMEQVVNRVVTRLLSMLDPTGIMAVVNSFIAFFNAVQSAIEYIREILEIIDSYVATLAAVARGDVQPGAAMLERGFASAIPVAIGFLANQVGLGNLASQIAEVIGDIRGYVDQALDWLLDRAVSMGRSILSSLGLGGGEEEEGDSEELLENEFLSERERFTTDSGERHSMYYGERGNNIVLIIESNPQSIRDFLEFYVNEYDIDESSDEGKGAMVSDIKEYITNSIDPKVEELEDAKANSQTDRQTNLQRELLDLNDTLSNMMRQLLRRDRDVGQIIDSYLLEGMVGRYASLPKVYEDMLTPDHQPQAEIYRWAAAQPFFNNTLMKSVGRGEVSQGFCVLIYHTRHVAGRTYGRGINSEFFSEVNPRLTQVTTGEEKRQVVIDGMKNELDKDTERIVNNVINKGNNDDIWADIQDLDIPLTQKNDLINTIRGNLRSGENQVKNQDLDRLKN